MAKTLYLVDGSGYIFRAYYAIRPLSNSKGLPTNAIYGFTTMLLKLIKDVKPEHLAIAFDTKEPTFRDEMYEEYKANRSEPPDDLVPQFEYIPKVVDALNIAKLVKPGFEADDLIGTVAKKAVSEGFDVVIVSGDKDLMQLVSDKVTMWDTMKEKFYKPADVVERFGVPPEKVVEVLGLAGDTSDNVPGISGVGPKTATKLIQKYGSVEELLNHAEKLTGKLKENVITGKKKALLSKKLVTIHCDVPMKFDLSHFSIKPLNKDLCHELFRELEFSRLLSELAPRENVDRRQYKTILSEADLRAFVHATQKAEKPLAIDLETDSLDTRKANIAGFSFAFEEGKAVYVPVGHVTPDAVFQLSLSVVREIISPLLLDSSVPKVGQNIKYDLLILKKHGMEVHPVLFDTMVASYLLNPMGPHNLDDLSQQYLDHRTIHYEDVVGKGVKQKLFKEISLEPATQYAAEDADCTLRLSVLFGKKLKEEGLWDLFIHLEMPVLRLLMGMEWKGVAVSKEILQELSENFGGQLAILEKKIYEMAGTTFNIQSPKQLGEVLFEQLKLPGGKKTKTGFSTRQDVLEELAFKHPLPALLLEFRSLSKLKSTYTDALLALIDPESRRIHTSFNQTIADTGRLSSSDPNLQNIPIRSEAGKKIRTAFIAEKGSVLVSADYSQIELRILAHLSKDPGLLKAFRENADVHRQTSSEIFGVAISKLTPEQRAVGKTVNFAVIYGQSPFGLSKQLGIDIGEAKEYIETYFEKYPKVREYRESVLESAREKGFVTTLLGRRRFVPDLLSHNIHMRQNAERVAFNTVFQGSAADIIKQAMVNIQNELPKISENSSMIVQVHDELLFEVPEKELERVVSWVRAKMESAYPLEIPLLVEIGWGVNWAEAH